MAVLAFSFSVVKVQKIIPFDSKTGLFFPLESELLIFLMF